MPTIQCPHCDDEIALDEGQHGLFDCPHCDKEFEWNTNSIAPPTTMTVVFVILALISGFVTLSLVLPSSADSDSSSESNDPCYMSENPDCKSQGDYEDSSRSWFNLFDGIFEGIVEAIFGTAIIAIGISLWVMATLCCGSMTIIFSIMAVRRYSADRVLYNSE